MHTKANKPWLLLFVAFTIGVFIGAALAQSRTPHPVKVTTSSQGRCAIKHDKETHIQDCQILQHGLAYIER